MKIKESLNVTFDETPPPYKTSPLVDDDLDEEEAFKVTKKKNLENNIEDETLEGDKIVNIKESKNHPLGNVIGNLNQRTLRMLSNIMVLEETNRSCYIHDRSQIRKRQKACQQALWMKQALIDYDIRVDDVPLMCNNKSAIDRSKNPVQHSQTKHIEIHHHFLQDNVQKVHISIENFSSEDNIPDILTKPLKHESFNYLRLGLGMMEHIS
uniref:Retrovirus-related Pol polyprotein from transposon TNT 1-94 n=1 Tax=Tanacetum cinerariifolium TaxID=118510 RepID=A0A699H4D9_TANCI|nr:retrovirus-related Pol polyprotein from transposon TNT 1-94 [Tanacetum cinerariifolium]